MFFTGSFKSSASLKIREFSPQCTLHKELCQYKVTNSANTLKGLSSEICLAESGIIR